MGFLFPTFLWGLLAVAVPLAIHLFNFRRTRRVLFTNVSFLKEIETRKSSFRRMKHLLILLARMLAIACLALAFAQPYLKKDAGLVDFQGIKSFYLDNSFSMQNEDNNKRFIDIATGSLDELLGVYSNLTSLQLVTNDFSPEDHSVFTASGLQDRLTRMELTPTSRTLREVYSRQKSMLENATPAGKSEMYWISDFQKSTAGDISKIEIDSADRLTLIPVNAGAGRNIYVDSVWLQTPFLRQGQKNVLNVRIRTSGREAVENLPVRLILNDTQVSASSADIPANGAEDVSFDFILGEEGYIRGIINFDDFPVTFDNQYYFVLNASPVIRILHLHAGSLDLSDPVNRVYRNDSLFHVTNSNADNADVGQVSVSDLVILNEIERLSPSLMSGIVDFVGKGGTLVVIPPGKPDVPSYKVYLEQMGVFGLDEYSGDAVPLSEPDTRIPFFQDVFEASLKADGQVNMPAAASVWQWAKAGNTLLSLRNGHQFLSQITVRQGKLYLLSAPLNAMAGNFSRHALFVPVMYKIAASGVRAQKTAYSFEDNAIELTVSDAGPNTVFKMRNGETEIIPVQRLAGNKLVLELPKKGELSGQALEPGYFSLETNGKTENVLALNLGKAESELAYYTAEELRSQFAGRANITIFKSIEDSDLGERFEKYSTGTRLWKYFLYAALVFLLAEILLVRLMKS